MNALCSRAGITRHEASSIVAALVAPGERDCSARLTAARALLLGGTCRDVPRPHAAQGARLRDTRHAARLSQRRLAESLGCSQVLVCDWETGKVLVTREWYPSLALFLPQLDLRWFETGEEPEGGAPAPIAPGARVDAASRPAPAHRSLRLR